jgi:hypothetical protein
MRGLPVCLRNLTAEEASAVKVLAHSRTAPAQRVERARLVWRASRGETPPCIAAALGVRACESFGFHPESAPYLGVLALPGHCI